MSKHKTDVILENMPVTFGELKPGERFRESLSGGCFFKVEDMENCSRHDDVNHVSMCDGSGYWNNDDVKVMPVDRQSVAVTAGELAEESLCIFEGSLYKRRGVYSGKIALETFGLKIDVAPHTVVIPVLELTVKVQTGQNLPDERELLK